MINNTEFLDFIKPVCLDAGQILNKSFGKIQYIKDKSNAIDLCTNADIESEKFITDSIKKITPNKTKLTFGGARGRMAATATTTAEEFPATSSPPSHRTQG